MKSHRSGLLGLALGIVVLGSAACDDQTEVVIPPPVAPPVTIAVSPSGPLDLIVGQTLQFVATVSGGAEGTVRTATWRSSNTAAATVNPTTGLVTGVAPGTTTITAIATADTLAKAAVAVNVIIDPANAPVQIALSKVTIGNTNTPVNAQSTFGQIDATITLDIPQGARVTRVELLLDNVVVASQAFSGNVLAVEDALELQADPVEIVLSVNTAAFSATTGAVAFPNGPHNISARVIRPNGTVTATPSLALTFNNVSFLNVVLTGSKPNQTNTTASPRSVAAPGSLWFSGDISAAILSVNYGPTTGALDADIANVTLAFTSSGLGATGVGGCTTTNNYLTDPTIALGDGGAGAAAPNPLLPSCAPVTAVRNSAAATNPFSIVFPAANTLTSTTTGFANVEDVFSLLVSSVTQGGQAGPLCINPDPVFNPQIPGVNPLTGNPFCGTFFANPPRIDNLAPRLGVFDMIRPNQYYGPNSLAISAVVVTAPGTPTCPLSTAFGTIDPCVRSVDYGVGGQTEGTNTTFAALQTDGSTSFAVTGAASFAGKETTSANCPAIGNPAGCSDYRLSITIRDKHQNARTLWATTTNTTFSTSATAAGVIRFGWDETLPTIAQVSGHANNSTNTTPIPTPAWVFGFSDSGIGPSGFNVNPVQTKLERFRGIGTSPICLNPNTGASISCTTNSGFVADDGSVAHPDAGLVSPNGYYQVTVQAQDAAGNNSTTLVVLTLHDRVVGSTPAVGGITEPTTITGGASATFTAALSDTVELGSLLPYVGFAGANFVAFPRQTIGTYGIDVLTGTNPGSVTVARFPRSLQLTTAAGLPTGAPASATDLFYALNDVAADRLLFVDTPWAAAPNDGLCPAVGAPDTGTQNCFLRQESIAANVGGPFVAAFGVLNTLNGANAAHGLFAGQPPTNLVVCNNVARFSCPAATTPLTTGLSVTLTGPASTFVSPFVEVNFYYLDSLGRYILIGAGSSLITDNTVLNTRTITYSRTWDVSNPRVRPAGVAGTVYTVQAIGINGTGDQLMSSPVTVTVHGN
jgi:hypothetical protein